MTGKRTPNLKAIESANAAYARQAKLPSGAPPAKRLCVITCMDARLDPLAAFGLDLGDAHVLRNAGGRVTADTLRSAVLSAHLLGSREFGVVHHTRCGVQTTNESICDRVEAVDVSHIDFLAFDDLDESVREDVEELVDSDLLPDGAVVWGAVFDIDTGSLRVVVEPTTVS